MKEQDILRWSGAPSELDALLAQGKPFDELYERCTDINLAPVYFGLDSTVISSTEIGKVAIRALVERILHRDLPPREILLSATLVKRASA